MFSYLKIMCWFILTYCHTSIGQRRIVQGSPITVDKRYMVYLIKAELSDKLYDNWICGGAIVNPQFIITSAACVQDVTYMYAIAGYKKYYNPSTMEFLEDQCILESRKRIIFSCVPKNYNFDFNKTERWVNIDIAAVKVETPYNFTQPISPKCSWIPNAIEISYDWRHSAPGRDAMVLGWGSKHIWRPKDDSTDYNQETLEYSPVRIQQKKDCKNYYIRLPPLLDIIDKYMICTMGPGNIDDKGQQINRHKPSADGCYSTDDKCIKPPEIAGRIYNPDYGYYYRRQTKENVNTSISNNTMEDDIETYGFYLPTRRNGSDTTFETSNVPFGNTRRHGICQNDHGGPLVTWIGAKEILIGTASLFLVRNGSCVGPYLFTSTQCNGAFLGCILSTYTDYDENDHHNGDDENGGRRFNIPVWLNFDLCDLPAAQRGFEVVKRRISWPDTGFESKSPTVRAGQAVDGSTERPKVSLSGINSQ